MGKHEEELARELQRRGMSRRDVLRIGLRMGLGAASMGLLLAACGQTASTEPTKEADAGGAAAEPRQVTPGHGPRVPLPNQATKSKSA